jgi:23S rRNA pseudouridine1911/1915/1917 synthase
MQFKSISRCAKIYFQIICRVAIVPLAQISKQTEIPLEYKGLRVDAALAKCLPDYSRSQICNWIKAGLVLVDGQKILPKDKIIGGEKISIEAQLEVLSEEAEEIELNIAYEDEDLFVVNKPAGLVMYPAAGHYDGTLLNAILHHAPECKHLPRAGIIHRLDKGTTGLCVVAKTFAARNALVEALEKREIKREYLALVKGEFISGATIDGAIDRHPRIRTKMAVVKRGGRPARTHYRINARFCNFTLLHVTLDTGRTHQIRVHMSHNGFPLVGDRTYGWRCQIPGEFSEIATNALKEFPRPALHAWKLSFEHPISKVMVQCEAPIPEDMQVLMGKIPKA